MKESTQLVSRCVYLNIIKVTDSQDILEKFIADGGWAIMNTWLVEAKNSENMALILEVLKVSMICDSIFKNANIDFNTDL